MNWQRQKNGKVMQLKGDLDEQKVGIKKAISAGKCPFFKNRFMSFIPKNI